MSGVAYIKVIIQQKLAIQKVHRVKSPVQDMLISWSTILLEKFIYFLVAIQEKIHN